MGTKKSPLKLVFTITEVFKDAIQCLCLAPVSKDFNLVWAGSYERIYVIHPESRQVVAQWSTHPKSRVLSLLAVEDEVWSSGNYKINIWNSKSFKQVTPPLQFHQGEIHCLELVKSLNSVHVWSGSFDKTIAVWDITSHKCLAQVTAHNDAVQSLADTGNGEVYSAGQRDKCIKCWTFDNKT